MIMLCFFQQFWENAPGQNWEKMIDLTSKLGEINDTEHNKGSKIYPPNQVISRHLTLRQSECNLAGSDATSSLTMDSKHIP